MNDPIVPDFLIWHCAGCGKAAVGKQKPCDCVTNVGTREGPNGTREQTWWDDPPDPRDAEIADLRARAENAEARVKRLEEALHYVRIFGRGYPHDHTCGVCQKIDEALSPSSAGTKEDGT